MLGALQQEPTIQRPQRYARKCTRYIAQRQKQNAVLKAHGVHTRHYSVAVEREKYHLDVKSQCSCFDASNAATRRVSRYCVVLCAFLLSDVSSDALSSFFLCLFARFALVIALMWIVFLLAAAIHCGVLPQARHKDMNEYVSRGDAIDAGDSLQREANFPFFVPQGCPRVTFWSRCRT